MTYVSISFHLESISRDLVSETDSSTFLRQIDDGTSVLLNVPQTRVQLFPTVTSPRAEHLHEIFGTGGEGRELSIGSEFSMHISFLYSFPLQTWWEICFLDMVVSNPCNVRHLRRPLLVEYLGPNTFKS